MGLIKTIIDNFNKKGEAGNRVTEVNKEIKRCEGINLNNLVVYAPKNINELNRVIDCVSCGQAVILDFGSIKKNDYIKVVDYLNGALYCLRANINCLKDELYVITPKTIKLSTL